MKKKELWVFAELMDKRPAPVFYELLSKAVEIAKQKDWLVASVVIGGDTKYAVESLKECSEKVYVLEHEKLSNYTLDAYASAFEKLVVTYEPEMILMGATGVGAELAPTVAAKVKTGLAAHCIDIRVDEERDPINCIVPAFGGKVVSEIYIPNTRPMMATIRPGILDNNDIQLACEEVCCIDSTFLNDFLSKEEFLEFIPNVETGISLDKANVVVAVGRGASSKEDWENANAIAGKLGGAVGWTRALIDTKVVDNEVSMIGTSGKSVKPSVLLGVGISGAAHFVCGIGKSKLIIGVNKDERASIFQYADYGVVGDAGKFMKALLAKL